MRTSCAKATAGQEGRERRLGLLAWVAEGQECPSSLARVAGKVWSVDNARFNSCPTEEEGCIPA
ncbi:MAG: hypothetical protein QNK86_11310 [Akkermansiaceae bacterium]